MKKVEWNEEKFWAGETAMLIEDYDWNEKELEILKTKGFKSIVVKIDTIPEEIFFEKILKYFDGWLMKENKKAKLNYWLKKYNLSIEELNIWCTY